MNAFSKPSDIRLIRSQISPEIINAHKACVLGDAALRNEISHCILMVLQSRQAEDGSVPVDFNICNLRLDVFHKITGRS